MRNLLTLLFSIAAFAVASGQDVGTHEIGLCAGYGTSDQLFDGVTPIFMRGSETSYTNTSVSGAWFLNYKANISETTTIGFTASFEQERGDWGVPKYESRDKYPLGVFNRTAYTFAPEMSFEYREEEGLHVYATFGAGVTWEEETDVFQAAYYSNARTHYNYAGTLTGAETKVPNNRTHINGYCSPVGIRFGKKLGGYIELGIGYKGLINGGILFRFGNGEIRPPHIPGKTDDIVVFPRDFPLDSTFKEMGTVRTGNKHFNKFTGFYQGIDVLKQKAFGTHANAIRIDKSQDVNNRVYSGLKGTTFFVKNKDTLKRQLKEFGTFTGGFANMVIYRPSKGHMPTATIYVNDTSEIELCAHDKYIYRIRQEGVYKIVGTAGDTVRLDIKFGHNYYLKVVNPLTRDNNLDRKRYRKHVREQRRTKVLRISEEKGELESITAKKTNTKDLVKGENRHKQTVWVRSTK